MSYFIYEILNTVNGKRYIGCTKNTEKRFSQHRRALEANNHWNPYLQNAYNKYGGNNFQYNTIIAFNSEDDMYFNERKIISESEEIYNIAEGGLGGDTYSKRTEEQMEITRKKLSDIAKVRNKKNLELHRENGIKLWEDDEYREKVLNSVRERSKDPEYREKVSEGVKKALEDPKMREKWSEVKKGKNNGRWLGYLIIYKDDKILEKYESIMEASNKTGLHRNTLSSKIKNGKPYKNKKSKYNGCIFILDTGGGCDA